MAMTREECNCAFTEVVSIEFSDVPAQESEIDFTFSEDFLRKMDNLIALQQDGIWRLLNVARRHVAMIAIIVLGTMVTACGINQVIMNLNKIVREDIREEFYAKVTAMEIVDEYQINKVSEGFEKIRISRSNVRVLSEYENKEDDVICLWQATLEDVKNIDSSIMHENISEKDYISHYSTVIRGLDVEIYENDETAFGSHHRPC